ncbi:MAG: adenylate/guanylate cyclase domain-containing protein [Elusimicrobiota bacterium]
MSEPVSRNLTILLTDIKGFTDRTSHQSRAEIQQFLDHHKQVVLPVLVGKGGTLVKTMGDAFLMTYESPTNAVLAGIQVQDALAAYNLGKPADQRIDVRVAINQGEVNIVDNDVFGEAVNITARIEAVADAGDVFFTEAIYLAMNKKEVPSSEVGLLQLKGIPEKVRVYRVKRETPVKSLEGAPVVVIPRTPAAPPPAAPLAASPAGTGARGASPWAIASVAVVLVGAVGLFA